MGFIGSIDRSKTLMYIKDNWLVIMVAAGVMILMWVLPDMSGVAKEVSNMNHIDVQHWFRPIPLH